MRLREFKQPRQRLDEAAIAPLWWILGGLLFSGGALTSYNNASKKDKEAVANWLNNNKEKNLDTIKKVMPYLVPGGTGSKIGDKGLNKKIDIEKLPPVVADPKLYGKSGKLPSKKLIPITPGPIGSGDKYKVDKKGNITPNKPAEKNEPGVFDGIKNWWNNLFDKDEPVVQKPDSVGTVKKKEINKIGNQTDPKVQAAPIGNVKKDKLDKAQPIDKKKKQPAPDLTITKPKAPAQVTVKPLDKIGKSDGAIIGNPGKGGEINKSTVIPGDNIYNPGKTKERGSDGAVLNPGQVVVPGTKGKEIGTTQQGVQSQTIGRDIATTNQGAIVRTMPPPPIAPPIADPNIKIQKYDPKQDPKGSIIYKGKEAPKNMVKFKPVDVGGVKGLGKRLQGK